MMHFGVETEEAVMQKIEGLEAEKQELTAQNLTMKAEIDAVKEKERESLKMVVTSKVSEAVKLGKIKEEAQESWVELGMCNLALMESSLDGISVNIKKPVEAQMATKETVIERNENYNFEYLSKNNPAELKTILKNDPEEYKRLFNEHKNRK